jgi:putative transposase
MPRKARLATPRVAHHVVNRGNDRQVVFREHFDHAAFIELMAAGTKRAAVRIYGYCLMPNHFHLLLQPENGEALSAYMQWVTGRYACTFRQQTDTIGHGHVFQRRFWNAPVYDIESFVATLRYIEANPCRSGLVSRAESWPWSSLPDRDGLHRGALTSLPFSLPSNWCEFVNAPQSLESLSAIREAIVPRPGRPKVEKEVPTKKGAGPLKKRQAP